MPGIERTLLLRLKLIADAGLIGLPNAGKSTFLAAVSAAKPKIADYPFTTLHPGLGVVKIDGRDFVLADIPGLIEGAHEGHGLGDRFLGHVERSGALVHLVDATGANAGADYRTIRRELKAYGEGLAEKAEIVALSKVDAVDEETLKKQTERLKRAMRELRAAARAGRETRQAAHALDRDADRRDRGPPRDNGGHRGAARDGGRSQGEPGRMGAVDLVAQSQAEVRPELQHERLGLPQCEPGHFRSAARPPLCLVRVDRVSPPFSKTNNPGF